MMLKKVLLPTFCLITTSAFAAIPGYYAGLQLGYGFTAKKNVTATVSSTTLNVNTDKRNGIAARAFVGYAVTPFYAMELGITRYNPVTSKVTVDGTPDVDLKSNLYFIDLLGRFTWINKDYYDLYTSAGFAYVLKRESSNVSGFNKSFYFYRPELEIGGHYKINKKMALGVSYQYIFGRGKLANAIQAEDGSGYIPTLNAAMLGFVYKF